jgi:hypothetical protein
VTSVHPVFYCERLREHTDLLCYVPYFVVLDDVPEHFATLAGCIYAHKVIVQSEKVRDTYIRVFKKHYGDSFGKPEDKFVALGSPKYDKVINFRREDFTLPDEWRELIGGRKVIFYNTSVGAILQEDESYLRKLKFVLDTFRNHDNVVLWWRPHPLNKAAYKAMRPQLLEEYEQIVSDYKHGGWGIYDDTADLHRAICWSDAYCGDWSSVVLMYRVTGKPIIIGNIDLQELLKKNETRFFPNHIYIDDNDIWVSVRYINALFKMNKISWELQFIGSFPGEGIDFLQSNTPIYYSHSVRNGIIYFAPFFAKEFAAYSIRDNSFEKLSFNKNENCRDFIFYRDFSGTIIHEDYVFFTPHLHPAIARLNIETKEIDYYSDWVVPLKILTGNIQDAFFMLPLVVDNSIWLAACGANAVVEFNMDTCISTVHEVGKKGYRYNGICFDGENYWLSPRSGTVFPVIKWNPQTGVLKEYPEVYFDKGDNGFLPIVYCDGYVWLLPGFAKHAVKIDVRTDKISIAEEFEPDLSENENNARKYCFVQTFGKCIYTYNEQSETFIEYNCDTKERREEVVKYSPKIIEQINENISEEIPESKNKTITRYINANADGTAGQAIYRFCADAIPG